MNKKAQLDTHIIFLLIMLVLVYLWIYLVNPTLTARVPGMLITHNITGLKAFLWQNLNLFFFITMFLVTIGYYSFMAAMKPRKSGRGGKPFAFKP